MSRRSIRRLVREGEFVAEVDVELVEAEGAWTPYLSVEDACKLDDVGDALRAGDIERAVQPQVAVHPISNCSHHAPPVCLPAPANPERSGWEMSGWREPWRRTGLDDRRAARAPYRLRCVGGDAMFRDYESTLTAAAQRLSSTSQCGRRRDRRG